VNLRLLTLFIIYILLKYNVIQKVKIKTPIGIMKKLKLISNSTLNLWIVRVDYIY